MEEKYLNELIGDGTERDESIGTVRTVVRREEEGSKKSTGSSYRSCMSVCTCSTTLNWD